MVTEGVILFRLVLAALLCAAIGIEREMKQKPAGVRTNVLVGLGSCLFTLASVYALNTGGTVDPTRIASNVVTGIGFLGAGLILRDREGVHGITTATAIWLVAAIGLAVGFGFYLAALAATFIGLTVLILSRDDKLPRAFLARLTGK